jgi:hypothetical protein
MVSEAGKASMPQLAMLLVWSTCGNASVRSDHFEPVDVGSAIESDRSMSTMTDACARAGVNDAIPHPGADEAQAPVESHTWPVPQLLLEVQ